MDLFFENLRIITIGVGLFGLCVLWVATVLVGVNWIERGQGHLRRALRTTVVLVVSVNLLAAVATVFRIVGETIR